MDTICRHLHRRGIKQERKGAPARKERNRGNRTASWSPNSTRLCIRPHQPLHCSRGPFWDTQVPFLPLESGSDAISRSHPTSTFCPPSSCFPPLFSHFSFPPSLTHSLTRSLSPSFSCSISFPLLHLPSSVSPRPSLLTRSQSPQTGRWGWPFGPSKRHPLLVAFGDPIRMPVNETGAKPTSEEVDKYHGELVTVRSEVEPDSRSFAVKKKKKKKKEEEERRSPLRGETRGQSMARNRPLIQWLCFS